MPIRESLFISDINIRERRIYAGVVIPRLIITCTRNRGSGNATAPDTMFIQAHLRAEDVIPSLSCMNIPETERVPKDAMLPGIILIIPAATGAEHVTGKELFRMSGLLPAGVIYTAI